MNLQGVILAGGQGSRMGGADKGLQSYKKKPLVCYALEALSPLCDSVIISCNRNHDRYSALGDNILVSDQAAGFHGPLSGLVSCFAKVESDWLLVSPCDTPLVPVDAFNLLLEARKAHVDDKLFALTEPAKDHPLHCLIHRSLFSEISDAFEQGKRSVYRVFNGLGVRWIEVPEPLWMANINRID